MQISGIKTKEDAIAAIEAFQAPIAGEKATEPQRAYIERQAALVNSAKDFIRARIAAVPDSVKVIGIEVRADVGEIEMFSLRIIQHK